MNKIFSSPKTEITYDALNQRAEIKPVDESVRKPKSIAMICFAKQNRSTWDSVRNFCLKHFSWNWIKVNHGAEGTTQLVNIASIARQLNLTPSEIHRLNKAGQLYNAICIKAEELTPEEAVEKEIAEHKKNPITNTEELKKLEALEGYSHEKITPFIIFFNSETNEIQVSDERIIRNMSTREMANSYELEASAYFDNSGAYLKIDRLNYSLNVNFPVDEPKAGRLRQAVLDIYKTPET